MTIARAVKDPPDPFELYRTFLEREDDRSGTVLVHHGRVKRPGKQVRNFVWVELRPLVPDVDERLQQLAETARGRYGLNQVLLIHRLGRVGAGDTVLFAMVSGGTRDRCFEGCRFLVDEVKREDVIRLIEHT